MTDYVAVTGPTDGAPAPSEGGDVGYPPRWTLKLILRLSRESTEVLPEKSSWYVSSVDAHVGHRQEPGPPRRGRSRLEPVERGLPEHGPLRQESLPPDAQRGEYRQAPHPLRTWRARGHPLLVR